MVFVDTGAWFARFVSDDPDHGRVTEWFAANQQPLVTTDYCVDETLTLLVARNRRRLALQVGHEFFNQTLASLHFVGSDEIHRAWILFQTMSATGMSFTDCTSKVVMDQLSIRTVVALDEHFRRFSTWTVMP